MVMVAGEAAAMETPSAIRMIVISFMDLIERWILGLGAGFGSIEVCGRSRQQKGPSPPRCSSGDGECLLGQGLGESFVQPDDVAAVSAGRDRRLGGQGHDGIRHGRGLRPEGLKAVHGRHHDKNVVARSVGVGHQERETGIQIILTTVSGQGLRRDNTHIGREIVQRLGQDLSSPRVTAG